MLPVLVLLTVWAAVDGPKLSPVVVDAIRPSKNLTVCKTGSVGNFFFNTLVAYDVVLLVTLTVLSFWTRHVPATFNESKSIAAACYSVLLSALLVVVISVVGSSGVSQEVRSRMLSRMSLTQRVCDKACM